MHLKLSFFSALISFFLYQSIALSSDYIELPISQFEAKAENIYQRIDDIINNPEPILFRYKPVGMKIKDKIISKNQIQFMATKEVLGISKTLLYKGTLDIAHTRAIQGRKCFEANLDFQGSADLIINNIEYLEMIICTTEKSHNHLEATIKSRLKKGNLYGGIISNIAKNLIADQVDPIIASIKEEIEK